MSKVERRARPFREDRGDEQDPIQVDAARHSPRHRQGCPGHQRLHLGEHGAGALGRHDDGRAAGVVRAIGDEQRGGVGHFDQAAIPHLKNADLAGGAEAVLDAAQESVCLQSLTFEVENGVDQVLDHARAGEHPLLGDVPDEEHGNLASLGQAMEA